MSVFWESFYQKVLLNSSVEFPPMPPSSLCAYNLYTALIFSVFTSYLELNSIFCITDECWSPSAVEELFVLVQMEN